MCMPLRNSLVETGAIGGPVYVSGYPAEPGSLLVGVDKRRLS